MGRKKQAVEVEPLEEFQDTAKTGRSYTVESGGKIIDMDVLQKAAERMQKRSGIDIRSAELVDQMFCNYKYKHTVGVGTVNTVSTKSEVPVHHDLVAAFRRLDAHLALICEEIEVNLIGDDIESISHQSTSDTVGQFTVTKLALDGSEDGYCVIISGLKQLSTGESIKLETPKIAIDASYPFATQLGSTVQDCLFEVEEYMRGKQADNPQQELPFAEDNQEEEA